MKRIALEVLLALLALSVAWGQELDSGKKEAKTSGSAEVQALINEDGKRSPPSRSAERR
jgi:hypothetical protein